MKPLITTDTQPQIQAMAFEPIASRTRRGTIKRLAPTAHQLMDCALHQDSDVDFGFYWGAGPAGPGAWQFAILFESWDGETYNQLAVATQPSTLGSLLELPWVVKLDSGSLEPLETDQLANGGNVAAIGREIIQFGEANLIGPQTYELGAIRRGLRGTDPLTNHQIGDPLLLLSGYRLRIEEPQWASVSRQRWFKVIGEGQSLEDVEPIQWINTGESLRPYAPAWVQVISSDQSLCRLDWKRRSRRGEAMDPLPLAEEFEAYLITVTAPDGHKIAYRTPTPSLTLTPVVGAIVTIQQLSSAVGPGRPLEFAPWG